MKTMALPSDRTIKRLFAVSGNRCAFPNCQEAISREKDIIIGRVCHIEANSPGGPRYNPMQSEEERQGFENLLLLCANHHIVIDSDFELYNISTLKKIKAEHESKYANGKEPTTEVVNKLLQTINGTFYGPTVITQGQMGGQAAIHIDNYGLRTRQITPASGLALISELEKFPKEKFYIHYFLSDQEAWDLALSIEALLVQAGWTSEGLGGVNRYPPLDWGIVLYVSKVKPSFQYFLNWLRSNGFETKGQIVDGGSEGLMISIGHNR